MCLIGQGPVHDMMREQEARQKAREDWAYRDEMRKLDKSSRLIDTITYQGSVRKFLGYNTGT